MQIKSIDLFWLKFSSNQKVLHAEVHWRLTNFLIPCDLNLEFILQLGGQILVQKTGRKKSHNPL